MEKIRKLNLKGRKCCWEGNAELYSYQCFFKPRDRGNNYKKYKNVLINFFTNFFFQFPGKLTL